MFKHDNLYMRAIEEADLEPLRQLHNHPSTLSQLTDPTFVTPAMQRRWFAGLGGGASRRYVIVEVGDSADAPVAMVRIDQLDHRHGNACIGLDVAVKRRGEGLGTRALQLLLAYCFEQLNLQMVWLWTRESNKIAQGMYRKLGFNACGRLPGAIYRDGKYGDLLLMSLARPEVMR
jgi:diamine N-acetyltransferase